MITCKSPIKVMVVAHALGQQLFEEHSHKFSRKDFTLPQLFSCLVLGEHQKKSFRGVEALLVDCSDLREAVGLKSAPDHNTLWRAFEHLIKPSKMNRALDLTAEMAQARGLDISGDSIKPSAFRIPEMMRSKSEPSRLQSPLILPISDRRDRFSGHVCGFPKNSIPH